MPYMTRDKLGDEINIWEKECDFFLDDGGYYHISDETLADPIITTYPKQFKQIFPEQKLPRKGLCKYVELRLYIPGEG